MSEIKKIYASRDYVTEKLDMVKTEANAYTDEKFASIGIPEASGQKQSDWNQEDETASDFIKNKPFGVTTEMVEYVPEQSITSDELYEGQYVYWGEFDYESGALTSAEVSINSQKYVCDVKFDEEYNVYFVGSYDSNEKTFEMCLPAVGETTFSLHWDDSFGETITLKVVGKVETVKKIDLKFLPKAILYGDKANGNGYLYHDTDCNNPITKNEFDEIVNANSNITIGYWYGDGMEVCYPTCIKQYDENKSEVIFFNSDGGKVVLKTQN